MFKTRYKIKGVFLIFFLFLCGTAKAEEVPKLKPEWVKTFGGSRDDQAHALQVLPDGNIIIAGKTYSYGASDHDIYVIKIDKNGIICGKNIWRGRGNEHRSEYGEIKRWTFLLASFTTAIIVSLAGAIELLGIKMY